MRDKMQKKDKNFIRKTNIFLMLVVFMLVSYFFGIPKAFSVSTVDQKRSQIQSLDQRISSFRKKAQEKANDVKSLNSQLEALDAEYQETKLRIDKINGEIQLTDMEIMEINAQIKKTENERRTHQKTLKKAIKISYNQGDIDLIEIVVSSNSLSDFISAESYMKALEQKINEAVKKIRELEDKLKNKKNELGNKRKDQDNLRKEQEVIGKELDNQIAAKSNLLAKTKGDQSNYSNLVAQSLREKSQVNSQIARLTGSSSGRLPFLGSSSRSTNLGHVNAGDVIGYQDNTGFSTGSHLHFGLYKGGLDIDPAPYLGGYISWPLNGTITQGYGGTFSHRGVGWPGGLDIVSYPGASVRAAHSGTIVFNGGDSGSGFGHYIIIDHGDGFSTLYGHLQ